MYIITISFLISYTYSITCGDLTNFEITSIHYELCQFRGIYDSSSCECNCQYGFETINKEVLFPFGYGLSYSKFSYSNLVVNKLSEYDYEVKVDVTNVGNMKAKEVGNMYSSGVIPSNDVYTEPEENIDNFIYGRTE